MSISAYGTKLTPFLQAKHGVFKWIALFTWLHLSLFADTFNNTKTIVWINNKRFLKTWKKTQALYNFHSTEQINRRLTIGDYLK